ncbi:PTS N-acetylgalactosamine transporter subunit IID [Enterobacter bugandensis]|uniref:PTS N-acetylgalactosamine transporter subunit IID n=1 Tax=Enterobacter bugandensis TaxID=881260 RepID=UPI003D21EC7C
MEISLLQAFALGLLAFIAGLDMFNGLTHMHRPVVLGPLVGLILGDLHTGILTGGTLELVWMGLAPLAGAQPPNVIIGTIVGTTFAITTGVKPDVAVGVAVPFAVAVQMGITFLFSVMSGVMSRCDRMAANADTDGIERVNYLALLALGIFYFLCAFLPIYFGAEHAKTAIAILPGASVSEETLLSGVNENVYEDQTIGAELTKKDINRVAWRSMLLQASFNYERMQASGWLYGLLPALKKIHTNKRDLARAMKGHMGFFNTHPFLVTFVIGIILAMERSKQDVNSIQSTKIAVGAPLGGIGDAMFWLTLLPICGGIGASLALQGSILGAVVFIVLFNVVHLGLRFGLAHYAYRMGVAAIPLIKANTKKVGHAASIVGMTVIGALVATYVRLNTTLEIKAGDAVVKLQTDVIDKLMPAFLPLVYTLTMFWLVRRGWSPLRLIGITVVLGVVGKFCHFL